MPTLFERIISGELPANIVYKDERVTAFRDIHPRAPTHILIVPNKPIPTSNDMLVEDEALVGHIILVAAQIARGEGIAEIAGRDDVGRLDLVGSCDLQTGGDVINHLRQQTAYIDAVGGAESMPAAQSGIKKRFLDQALAVVKCPVNPQ